MDVQSTTEEKVAIRIAPVTASGKPAAIDGLAILSITSGNATAVAATQAEIDADTAAGKPGLVGYLVSEDAAGESVWAITADADLTSAVSDITDGGNYTYTVPEAVSLGTTEEVLPK